MVVGGDQRSAGICRDLGRDGLAISGGTVIRNNLGPVPFGVVEFDLGRIGRHHDRRRYSAVCRGRGDSLRVVPGGVGNNPLAAHLLVQRQDEVEGATYLERPGALQYLGLEPDIAPVDGSMQQWRSHNSAGDPGAGSQDIGDCG